MDKESKVKVTILAEGKDPEEIIVRGYYQVIHTLFDLIIFRIAKQNVTIKIEFYEKDDL